MSFQIAYQTLKFQKYKAIILFILLYTFGTEQTEGLKFQLKDMKDWRIWYTEGHL